LAYGTLLNNRLFYVASGDFNAVLEDLIKMCDVALMMGAPISGENVTATSGENVVSELASKLSEYLREKSLVKVEVRTSCTFYLTLIYSLLF
jgi:hypothetical protein